MTFIRDIGVRSHLIATLPAPYQGTAVLAAERLRRPGPGDGECPPSSQCCLSGSAHTAPGRASLWGRTSEAPASHRGAALCWGRRGGPQAVPLQSHHNSPCGLSPTCSHRPAPAQGTRAPGIPRKENYSPVSFSNATTPTEGHKEVLPGGTWQAALTQESWGGGRGGGGMGGHKAGDRPSTHRPDFILSPSQGNLDLELRPMRGVLGVPGREEAVFPFSYSLGSSQLGEQFPTQAPKGLGGPLLRPPVVVQSPEQGTRSERHRGPWEPHKPILGPGGPSFTYLFL